MDKIFIFDLDGTLVDSMPIGVGIVVNFLEKRGVSLPSEMIKTLTPLCGKHLS